MTSTSNFSEMVKKIVHVFLMKAVNLINLLNSQNREACSNPNWVQGTTFSCQDWSPGPILVDKFGPARTSFGKRGPSLTTKSSLGGGYGRTVSFRFGHPGKRLDTKWSPSTVKPPNKGHIGDGALVPCREVVLFLEVFF